MRRPTVPQSGRSWILPRRLQARLKRTFSLLLVVSTLAIGVANPVIQTVHTPVAQAAPVTPPEIPNPAPQPIPTMAPPPSGLPAPVAPPADQRVPVVAATPTAGGTGATGVVSRGPFSVTTRNADGSFTAQVSARPMHWQDPADGQWKPFDNTIRAIAPAQARAGFAQENSAGPATTSFADAASASSGKPLAAVQAGDKSVQMAVVGAKPASVTVQGNQITYTDAFPGVDIRLTQDNERLKDDISLKSAAAVTALAKSGVLSLDFDLTLSGLIAAQQADGSVLLKDTAGKTVFVMPPPVMSDQAKIIDNFSYQIGVTLTPGAPGQVRLTLKPDLKWLTDPARVYPVTLDPTTTIYTAYTGIDSWISNATDSPYNYAPNNYGTDANLVVGKDTPASQVHEFQSLVQFNLTEIPPDSVVTSATMNLYANNAPFTTVPVNVHRVTSAWNEVNPNGITWNNAQGTGGQGLMDAAIETTVNVPYHGTAITFPLTSLVGKWVRGDVPNYGVRLEGWNANWDWVLFNSLNATSNKPTLSVTYYSYTNVRGLGFDRDATYSSQDHGGGNTSLVNVANGNLVFVHPDSSVAARGFSVDLAHFYNSQDDWGTPPAGGGNAVDGAAFGRGWTFSYNIRAEWLASPAALRVKDGTGKWHVYLDNGNNTFTGPPNDPYTLIRNGDGTFTLTAVEGGKRYSLSALHTGGGGGQVSEVTQIVDRSLLNTNPIVPANTLTFTYSSGNNRQLLSIKDVANRTVDFTYGAGGLVSQVKDLSGRTMTFAYDGYGNLATITNGANTGVPNSTNFIYHDGTNTLWQVTNQTGGNSYLRYKSEGNWDAVSNPVNDGWTATSDCGASLTLSRDTTTGVQDGWAALGVYNSLRINPSAGVTCLGVQKSYGANPVPLSNTTQTLMAALRVPAGTPVTNAQLFYVDKGDVRHSSPLQGIQASGTVWTAISFTGAQIDMTTPVKAIGVYLTFASAYSGAVYLDNVAVRGIADAFWDNLAVAQNLYSYDWANKLSYVNNLDSTSAWRQTAYHYDGFNAVNQATDPYGNVTTLTFDSQHRLSVMTPPAANGGGGSYTFAYADPVLPFLSSVTDPLGHASVQGVDLAHYGDVLYSLSPKHAYLQSHGQAFIATVLIRGDTYNPALVTRVEMRSFTAGTPLTQIDTNHGSLLSGSTFTYHRGGLLASTTDPVGNQVLYEYDNQTNFVVDNAARTKGYPTLIRAPAYPGGNPRDTLITLNAAYDDGLPTVVKDATLIPVSYSLDGLGRVTNIGHNGVFSEVVGYNADSSTQFYKDGNNHQTNYTYDANRRLLTTLDARGKISTFVYNANGTLYQKKDPLNHADTYTYDWLNRLSSELDPNGMLKSYSYDARGNQATVQDPNQFAFSVRTAITYDAANRVTNINYPAYNGLPAINVSYTLDDDGKRLTMVDPNGTTIYQYDAMERLARTYTPKLNVVGSPCCYSVEHQYDPAGNLILLGFHQNDPNPNSPDATINGKNTAYTYNVDNQLKTVTDWARPAASYAYDAAGRETTFTYPYGTVRTKGYDTAGRLTSLHTKNNNGNGTDFVYATYTLDGAGNRTQAVEHIGTTNYLYDELNRMTRVTYPNSQQVNYTYDDAGNRTSMVDSVNGTTNYAYFSGGQDRLQTVTLPGGSTWTYGYDGSGNQRSKTDSTGTTYYNFDAAGRMSSLYPTSGGNIDYKYDGDGQRVYRGQGGVPLPYVNDGGRLIYDGENINVYGNELIVADHSAVDGNSTTFVYDALGSVRAHGQGGPTEPTFDYDAFGQLRAQNGVVQYPNDHGFTGESQGREGGLVKMGVRYYDPSTGRFTTKDPLVGQAGVPQSLNRYAYTRNNPVNLTDHSGMCSEEGETREDGTCVDANAPVIGAGAGTSSLCAGYEALRCFAQHSMADAFDRSLEELGNLFPFVADAIDQQNIEALEGDLTGSEPGALSIEDLLNGSKVTKGNNTIINAERSGGMSEAENMFNQLMGKNPVKTIQTPRGPMKVGKLPNGETVVLREYSEQGSPTLEIQRLKTLKLPDIKIRFGP